LQEFAPIVTTAASLVNARMGSAGAIWHTSVSTAMGTAEDRRPLEGVTHAIHLVRAHVLPGQWCRRNDTAIAGMKMACMTREPIPYPACAAEPKSRIT
jgi:hypothetical protein